MFQECRLKDILPVADWKITLENKVLGMFDIQDFSKSAISTIDGPEINPVNKGHCFVHSKWENTFLKAASIKAVTMCFMNMVRTKQLKDQNHHIISKLNPVFSKKSTKRINKEIENAFRKRMNPVDLNEVLKSIILICDVLMSEYGDKGIG